MTTYSKKIRIDTQKTVLSSFSCAYKTERFLNETKRIRECDLFLSKIFEALITELDALVSTRRTEFKISINGRHDFYFMLGLGIGDKRLNKKDVLFTRYETTDSEILFNDGRFAYYLQSVRVFDGIITEGNANVSSTDFNKIYRVQGTDKASFPLLSSTQKEIVETENKNVLVQGVAGSGKTNICIDKILFAASREYRGRVLYTTFSRGLLIDTQAKINSFNETLSLLIGDIKSGRVVYADKHHKEAIENRLGIELDCEEEGKILLKLEAIRDYLNSKVDYYLIEDLYVKVLGGKRTPSGEESFTRGYLTQSYVEGQIAKLKNLSAEVIYKEIFGLIFGSCDGEEFPPEILPYESYVLKRSGSFTRTECEVIYRLARDYKVYLLKRNLTDNNFMSRELIANIDKLPRYSLSILDEVQDMTEVNLALMNAMSLKLFCVGDALQMINPSYFSFAYLKRLLYTEDTTDVKELANNYRNTKKIADIIGSLGTLNVSRFGTHSFVLKGVSVETDVSTSAVIVDGKGFLEELKSKKFSNYTLIVSNLKQKARMRALLGNREILTVSEIKGLERDTVILYNVLSDNYDKWEALERISVNRKTADENSVYRYYFNLFYVAVSRAKANVYVYEDRVVPAFTEFFRKEFTRLKVPYAIAELNKILSVIEIEEEELLSRIRKFVSLGQFDNARIACENLKDELKRKEELKRIEINELYVLRGNYRDAGIRYWEAGLYDDAEDMFKLSGDHKLIEFMRACLKEDNHALDYDIVRFYTEVEGNDIAQNLILETLRNDLKDLREKHKNLNASFKALKEKRNG